MPTDKPAGKPADKLTETTDEGKIELNEKDLNQVTAGTGTITCRKAGAEQEEFIIFGHQ
jgi:hypothetical protein